MKRFRKLILVITVIVGLSNLVDAGNGQIQASVATYGNQFCIQQFTCTPSGWVASGDPTWFTIDPFLLFNARFDGKEARPYAAERSQHV